jgi:predicted Zn-dependent protease
MRPTARQYSHPGIRLRLFLTLVLINGTAATGISGCAVNPATGRPTLTGLMSTADEIRIGREQRPQILQAFGGSYGDPKLNGYVERVGQTLARGTERTDIMYSFTVLNTPIVNALATPGGYIYVTRGLLALADDEAELAGVLGHELGHVAARHHAQQQSRQTLASIGMLGAAVAASAIGAPPVLMQGTQLAALGFLRAFSRQEEFEADQLGARYMSKAGYDPHAMITFLRKLQAHRDLEATMLGEATRAERFDFLATHPNTADRIHGAIDAARVTIVARPTVGRDSYLDVIDGMLYGARASEGFIRGRVFSHPVLRIRFEVPPEYQLFDASKAVYAQGPGDALIIFDSEPQPAKYRQLTMAQYVSGATSARLGEVQAMRVDGLDAATGSLKVQSSAGPVELRLGAIRTDAAHIYRFRFVTPLSLLAQLGSGNLRTFQSFRVLTAAEAAKLKPLRVRVVTVKPRDTVATLAKRMAFDSYAAERFRVLNGLPSGAQTVSSERVKIVTE